MGLEGFYVALPRLSLFYWVLTSFRTLMSKKYFVFFYQALLAAGRRLDGQRDVRSGRRRRVRRSHRDVGPRSRYRVFFWRGGGCFCLLSLDWFQPTLSFVVATVGRCFFLGRFQLQSD